MEKLFGAIVEPEGLGEDKGSNSRRDLPFSSERIKVLPLLDPGGPTPYRNLETWRLNLICAVADDSTEGIWKTLGIRRLAR